MAHFYQFIDLDRNYSHRKWVYQKWDSLNGDLLIKSQSMY
jgi:hypothetical protein